MLARMLAAVPPPPPPRPKWTRRVPHPVLTGHVSSLGQVRAACERRFTEAVGGGALARWQAPPRPSPVLTGHVSSFSPY